MLLLSMIDFLKELDTQLLLAINSFHTTFLDSCMHYASHKFFWIPLYLFLLYLLFKNFGKQSLLPLVFVALTITLSDQISLHLFKNVFLRYRPCHNLLLATKVHLVDECGGMYGFVSSHAANTFAISFLLYKLLGEKFKAIRFLFIWAAVVSYSRVYLAQHYPSDVFCGAMVGIGSAWIASKLYFYTKERLAHV